MEPEGHIGGSSAAQCSILPDYPKLPLYLLDDRANSWPTVD